jgi:hypothetical protein
MRDTAAATVSRRHHLYALIGLRPALRAMGVLFLVGGALLTTGPSVGAAASAKKTTPPPCNLGLDAPDATTAIGHNFFVANSLGNSVTEVNGKTGACETVFSGSTYRFADPTAMVAVGKMLFVANSQGTSSTLTEFNPTSSTATVLSGSGYGFDNPIAMAVSGTDLFVLNSDNVVSEVNTSTGAAVTTFSGTKFAFSHPTSIAAWKGEVFVVDAASNSVTAFAPATGVVSIISGVAFQFDFTVPAGVPVAPAATAQSGVLWVTSPMTSTVTEITIKTLAVRQVVTDGNLATPGPVVANGEYVFTASPPSSSPMITQLIRKTSVVTWMMCNTNDNYFFNDPQSLVIVGSSLWIVNEGGVSGENGNIASLTQMNIDSGDLIRVVS